MEKCVSKEILFDYYNESLVINQMNSISRHLKSCKQCQAILDEIGDNISLSKEYLSIITPELDKIPDFTLKQQKSKKINEFKIRKTLSWAAGISLLITISALASIKISHNLNPVNDYEYLDYIPDMNDAWQNNTIVVTQYDNNGNPLKHQLIETSN
ncbi:MAG: hypothetical protein JEY96_07750 [Bacteroidales bacterium]|nr:hypothetical protein [Bacteroidales bacterium]